jgi:predicted acetyltransferase
LLVADNDADPTAVQIRLLRPGDDLDAHFELNERSFGAKSPDVREHWLQTLAHNAAHGRGVGAFAGDRPVGTAMFHDMRQWWRGRAVPMAGVGSVAVSPDERGRGIGRRLMVALLAEMAGRGYPISVLFPATMPLYRSLGWELAGARETAVLPARSLRPLAPADLSPDAGPVALKRAGLDDAAAVIATIGRVHETARDCGPITWDEPSVRQWLGDPELYAYLTEDGFLIYHWHDGNDAVFVEGAEAISGSTIRAFWSHVGSHASIAEKVYVRTGPADPFWWLTLERDADVTRRSMWMLRVVDAPAAIAARGFPAATALSVPLDLADGTLPANSGRWELTVAEGKGALNPLTSPSAAGPPLALGPRGLAALYAGAPLATLRQAGLASGGSADGDAALDAAFGATAYMLDSF